MLEKILEIAGKHKKIVFMAIVALAAGGFGYKILKGNGAETKYVLAAVEKGNLISAISGSGQVSSLNQVDIKPKVSGDVLSVAVKNGQEVKAGTLLLQLDSQDAQRVVRDAEIDLENAKISLSQTEATQNVAGLRSVYDSGFNAVTEAFLDLPVIMSGLKNILFGSDLDGSYWNLDVYNMYHQTYDPFYENNPSYQSYQTAKSLYEQNLAGYKSISGFSSANLESLLENTYQTTKAIAESLRNAAIIVRLYQDDLKTHYLPVNPFIDNYLSDLSSYTSKINKDISGLSSAIQNVQVKADTDPLNLQAKELAVEQRENALADAKERLADYSVRAPFDGVIGNLNVKNGDSLSSGAAIATLMTKQQIAEISLNEVDAAKVKVDQKANLAFDAVDGLNITGKVSDMDTIGTVTQGVVTYDVKIAFDTQDDRVKSGMSVSASIITDVKQDVLLIPNSAVKSAGNSSYVEMPSEAISANMTASANGIMFKDPPRQQAIQVGLSNDSYTEVADGLKEGDQIIIRTIAPKSAQTQTSTSNMFQSGNARRSSGGGGGAMMRIPD